MTEPIAMHAQILGFFYFCPIGELVAAMFKFSA